MQKGKQGRDNVQNCQMAGQEKVQSSESSSSAHEGPSQNQNQYKSCNCKKSKCMKMYCECFLGGTVCSQNCKCIGCQNTISFNEGRRIPEDEDMSRKMKVQNRGCNCKKSECLKKYCQCFNAGISCNSLCKCQECKNMDFSGEAHIPQKSVNKQFLDKLDSILLSVPQKQRQSMLQFIYYLID